MKEFDLIAKIKKQIPRRFQGKLGIGDDTEIFFESGGQSFIVTSDALVENVDFRKTTATPEQVGRKALAVNLSDLAAMGANPVGFTVTIGLPRGYGEKWVRRFYKGMMPLAKTFHVPCLGGDFSRSKTFFVSIAMIGKVLSREIVLRKGARPGDLMVVTGKLGGSIAGHHFDFTPRIREARFLAQNFHPTSMIDVSDGLIQDLKHILETSKVGAAVDLDAIPVLKEAKGLTSALSDGEDFELLFTISKGKKSRLEKAWKRKFPNVKLSWIGKIEKGKGVRWMRGGRPVSFSLKKEGFQHF